MSNTLPTVDGSAPVPNAWKKRANHVYWIIIAGLLCVIVAELAWYATHPTDRPMFMALNAPAVQPAPPQSKTVIEYTESIGGKDHVKGNTHGPDMSVSGEKVEAKDMQIAAHDFTLVDVGTISGGMFSGSIKASVSGSVWIRIIFALLALAAFALAYLNFRKNPLDWHFYGSLALGGVLCVVVAANPELLYVGLAGIAIAAVVNFLPSIMATKTTDAAQWYDDFTESDPDIKAKWIAFRAKMPAAAKSVIDNVIRKSNV